MEQLKRIRAELKTRDWNYEATTFLFHAEAMAWKRVQKLCALAEVPDRSPNLGEVEALAGPQPDSGKEVPQNPTVSPPFSHQKPGSGSELQVPMGSDLQPLLTKLPPDTESPQPALNPSDDISPANAEAYPKLASLDPGDPNFHDGSIVIGPGESFRSILERYGVKSS